MHFRWDRGQRSSINTDGAAEQVVLYAILEDLDGVCCRARVEGNHIDNGVEFDIGKNTLEGGEVLPIAGDAANVIVKPGRRQTAIEHDGLVRGCDEAVHDRRADEPGTA
jgi:hypothetical protein